MRPTVHWLCGLFLFLAGVLGPASGHGAETQPTLLTIDRRDGTRIEFTLSELESLPANSYATRTPWHDGLVKFEGVALKALFDKAGLNSGEIIVEALNGYRTIFPVNDAQQFPVILAYKKDGQYMSLRDKGPLFIIYPYDSSAALQNERYYARSAWQTRRFVEQ
ncbi:MAG: molybdopterin-dependent oxidoreductase [Beijerinckiaceae bacterium]